MFVQAFGKEYTEKNKLKKKCPQTTIFSKFYLKNLYVISLLLRYDDK